MQNELVMPEAPVGTLHSNAINELLQPSLAEKKGLAIFLGGQVLIAIFVARHDAHTLVQRSQAYARLLLRIDRIDAIAISERSENNGVRFSSARRLVRRLNVGLVAAVKQPPGSWRCRHADVAAEQTFHATRTS
jgi:hypothetical protein